MNKNNNLKVERCIPTQLLKCARLPRSDKIAIFKDRQSKILNFLSTEGYSGIKNIAALIDTHRQTVMRIMKRLCDEKYVLKSNVHFDDSRKTVIYQITNTGMMLIFYDAKILPVWDKLLCFDNLSNFHHFKLQAIRISLQQQGYKEFQKPWQLLQTNHAICQNYSITPEYLCLDLDNNKVAIAYEDVIQSNQSYKQIIEQYIKAKQDEVIDKALFFTRSGFADKLRKLFIYISDSTAQKNIISQHFHFLEN